MIILDVLIKLIEVFSKNLWWITNFIAIILSMLFATIVLRKLISLKKAFDIDSEDCINKKYSFILAIIMLIGGFYPEVANFSTGYGRIFTLYCYVSVYIISVLLFKKKEIVNSIFMNIFLPNFILKYIKNHLKA